MAATPNTTKLLLLKVFIFIITALSLISCSSLRRDNFESSPISEDVNLFAFVGKKIAVVKFDPNVVEPVIWEYDPETGDSVSRRKAYIMDNAFRCTYQVVKQVYNKLQSDTIHFKAYDHYGRPGFEPYDYVLLYISKDTTGAFYHQKYQFDPVRQRWGKLKGSNGKSLTSLRNDKKQTVFKERNLIR